jgi:crotonobetainyl-CoA:carnitine CoA-transferase CaiB-like acyl-CoA transferase/RimJ/RimL family protein N-acetyltransferase
MLLADLGAEVVKVERPDGGDTARAWGPPFIGGESTYFLSVNRGKRSIALDLRHPDAPDVLARLVGSADVVVENFLPAAAQRLGLAPDVLAAAEPRLVLCSIRGYPPESEAADDPGFDFAIQGEGGLMSITGAADGPPMKVGVAVADIAAGLFASSAILAALLERERTGRGRHVQVSLLDAQLAWLANRGSEALVAGADPARLGNDHPSISPYATFRAADGYLNLAVGTDAQWQRLREVARLGEAAADERLATNAGRVRHRGEVRRLLEIAVATRPVAAWVQVLRAAGVPCGPVHTVREALDAAPWAPVDHDHATVAGLRTVRSPIAVDGRHPTAERAPPLLGADTADVLRELGLGDGGAARLLAGACAVRPPDGWPRLRTERLDVVPLGLDAVSAAMAADRVGLQRLLGAEVPPGWPEPVLRHRALPIVRQRLLDDPAAAPWGTWAVLHAGTLVGSVGIKGPPDARGSVEIGYGILAEWRRRGFAREAAGALVAWALAQPGVARVLAECDPANTASVRVLETIGMRCTGTLAGLLRWEREA